LGADNQAGDTGTVVVDFGEPFLAHVFKGGGRGDGKADQEDVGLGIGQGAQSIIILLAGGIEQPEGIRFVTDPDKSASLPAARDEA
jgi:hypothetical protein